MCQRLSSTLCIILFVLMHFKLLVVSWHYSLCIYNLNTVTMFAFIFWIIYIRWRLHCFYTRFEILHYNVLIDEKLRLADLVLELALNVLLMRWRNLTWFGSKHIVWMWRDYHTLAWVYRHIVVILQIKFNLDEFVIKKSRRRLLAGMWKMLSQCFFIEILR